MKRDISWASAITLIAALLVMAYGFSLTPKYTASVRVLVGVDYRVSPTAPATRAIEASLKKQSGGKIQLIPNATPESFEEISDKVATALNSRAVAEETIRRLNLKMSPSKLLKNLTAETEPGAMFILVTYTDTEPKRAQQVANTVGQIAHERARSLDLNAMDGGVITATLWEPAKLPATPVIPNPLRNGLITLAIGLALSLVVIVLREYLRENYR